MQKKIDGFIIDTCKNMQTDKYIPGAIIYAGRKQMETKQWPQTFDSQEDANNFVRGQLANGEMREMQHVGELPAMR